MAGAVKVMVLATSTWRMEMSQPVAGFAVGAVNGSGSRDASVRRTPGSGRAEPVADLLQLGRILAGSEPVRQFFEGQARPGRLAFGPLVPVEQILPGRGSRRRS